MTTYIAVTTTGTAWKVLAYGTDKTTVEQKAREIIGDPGAGGGVRDIYAETEHKNLRMLSKTAAKRRGIDYDDSESFVSNFTDAVLVAA